MSKLQQKKQYINLYFTKDDKEILAWANLIRENGLSLSTWIQGILVAESIGTDLDIGSIGPPISKPLLAQTKPSLFGDDTITEKTPPNSTGWNIRGKKGELKIGSILTIKVTRPIVQDVILNVKKIHPHLGIYIKFIIRRKLKCSLSTSNRLPNPTDLIDIFIISEEKKAKYSSNNAQKKENSPKLFKTKQNHSPNPTLTHPPKNNINLQSATPQQKNAPEKKQREEPKIKNPLLNYINSPEHMN